MSRPPVYSVKKLVAITPDMAVAIEDFRFAGRIGSESEAIRRLIARGLEAEKEHSAEREAKP